MSSAFATEAAFLVATEGTGWIEFVVGIRPDHAGSQFVDDLENLAAFVGPDPGAQTVGSVVRALDRFFRCAEGHHAEDGAEDFFLRDSMRSGDAGEETWRIPIAFCR